MLKKQTGITTVEVILVVLMLAAAGFVGWTWYKASSDGSSAELPVIEETEEKKDTPTKPDEELEVNISQGMYGKVLLRTGNCMPGPGDQERENDCEASPVETTVYVREPTTRDNMESQYLAEESNLVKQVGTNEEGFYEVELAPGTYSVFVEDDGKEYCNRSDGQGRMCPVKVGDGTIRHDIEIDHAAW